MPDIAMRSDGVDPMTVATARSNAKAPRPSLPRSQAAQEEDVVIIDMGVLLEGIEAEHKVPNPIQWCKIQWCRGFGSRNRGIRIRLFAGAQKKFSPARIYDKEGGHCQLGHFPFGAHLLLREGG